MRRMAEIANEPRRACDTFADRRLLGPHRRQRQSNAGDDVRRRSTLRRAGGASRALRQAILGKLMGSSARSRKGSRWSSRRRRCAASGTAGGFKMQIEDRTGGHTPQELQAVIEQI